ncbi:MAG: histidinol-phosphate transaminase [Flavobacteriaceae bacterium]|nr:histidinol-phosphate transaminase [Flavobacteriaceae bacterium]
MNIQDLIRDNVKSLKPYSSARDEYKNASANMVFLDANENPFNTGCNRYPDPQQNSVKDVLAKQKGVSKSKILLGNGSDEVLDLIFRAFCNPNKDNIITLPPTYGMYEVLANINAIEIIKVNLSDKFQPQVDTILKASNQNSKLLFLCSPNNPSGNSFSSNEVETLLNEFNGIVVIDEAYIDFSEQKSWLNRLDEFSNLIVTQTLSKAYGMAGIRLGICYASEDIISVLNKIKPPYNVNSLSQEKAIEQLLKTDVLKHQIIALKYQREILEIEFNKLEYVRRVYPSDANFLLIKVDDAKKRYNQLIEKGIVVRNRTSQPLCENCLRITIGTKQENEKLIEVLKTL